MGLDRCRDAPKPSLALKKVPIKVVSTPRRAQQAYSYLDIIMNTLILTFVTSLALANGRFFTSIVTPYGVPIITPYVVTYFSPDVFQPKPTLKTAEEVATPIAHTSPVSPVTFIQSVEDPSAKHAPILQTVPLSSLFHTYHSQSKDGSYSFGYYGGPSSKAETRDQFGNVQGSFNYVDPLGNIHTRQYVADGSGFRVAASDLPLAPVVSHLRGPEPVEETAEVKIAKDNFIRSFQKAKTQASRSKRNAEPDFLAATAYRAPASTFPLNLLSSNIPFATTYTVKNQFPFSQPYFYNLSPTLYSVPKTASVAYPQLPYSSLQPIFKFKPATTTAITHHPNAVSYRINY